MGESLALDFLRLKNGAEAKKEFIKRMKKETRKEWLALKIKEQKIKYSIGIVEASIKLWQKRGDLLGNESSTLEAERLIIKKQRGKQSRIIAKMKRLEKGFQSLN